MEENDMFRLRLVFDDRQLLDKSLRSQGLRRCWFLLKPGISTIRKLASHIRESFGIQDRIVLFLDGFVLPSFESTNIISGKDIITVKKKETKQKDFCKPCDGQSLMQESQIAMVHDLPFNNDLLSDDKSQKKSHGSGSYDKEKMISCTKTAVHLDPNTYLAKRKRKHYKQLLGSNSQSKENNPDHEFEPSNSSDVIKNDSYKKQARTQTIHHSSDGEEGVAPYAVQSGLIRIQPLGNANEYDTQQVDEMQPLLFDGSSSMNRPITNTKKNFPQTTDNDRCIKINEAPIGDGLLPLPNPRAMSSTNNMTGPHKEAACQKDSAVKDKWEEALAKKSENELNVLPAVQSNEWPQWIPNKNSTPTSWSIPEMNNGKIIRAPDRNRNPMAANKNIGNRNFNMYPTNWDLNRSNASGNTQTTLPWSYNATGRPSQPTLWNSHQSKCFSPRSKHFSSGKQ